MCARPFMPPPPRTRMNRVSLFTGIAACPEGELPSNVVVAPMPALLIRHRIMRSRWTIAGLTAGYYGRWADAVLMRIADVTLAFPSLLLLIAIAAAVKPSLPVVCVVIGLVGWAGMARLVRGQVLVVRALDYVQAARALGAS